MISRRFALGKVMAGQLKPFLGSFKSKLSQRIALWVFSSLVVIEAIILIPSVYNRERELLKQLEEVCAASVAAIVPLTQQATSDAEVLDILRAFKPQLNTQLLGGMLYRQDGQLVGTFGEAPQVSSALLAKLQMHGGLASWKGQLDDSRTRFDIGIAYPSEMWPYILILRYDLTLIHREVMAYVVRIIGLVVIIAVVVTITTMVGTQIMVINPVLKLRSALEKAGESTGYDQAQPTFETLNIIRRDELGDVSQAFNETFQRIIWEMEHRRYTEQCLRDEQAKSEQLLFNILPMAIAEQLKQSQNAIAQRFDEVTILFADIVNFTQWASRVSPVELVNVLNGIFSRFDQLAELHGLEKIKTIGDAYMVVGGLPSPRDDHAVAIANMALDMQRVIKDFRQEDNTPFRLRIGINTGMAVAGVIGIKKFIYDLWGDAVNIASRMEAQGVVDGIQVTESTYQKLCQSYRFESRGLVDIKGKGAMTTYLLLGEKTSVIDHAAINQAIDQ